MPETAERPRIWVYKLQPVDNRGLSYTEAEIRLTRPNELRDEATKRFNPHKAGTKVSTRFQQEYDPPFLPTSNGLDHPAIIYANGSQLPFLGELKPIPLEPGERLDYFTYSIKRDQAFGKGTPVPEQLRGRGAEIWALNPYPNKKAQIFWEVPKESDLFDPNANEDTIKQLMHHVYQGLVEYSPELESQKPLALLWRMGEQLRIVTRPHRLNKVDKEGLPIQDHRSVIATTLPGELFKLSIALA